MRSISLPNSMRPSSPPEITFTDLLLSSFENSNRPSVARSVCSSSFFCFHWRIQSNSVVSSAKSSVRSCATVADLGIRRPLHDAALRLQLADQALQQRRLADAVRTDDRDALADLHHQIEILEQRRVVAFGEAFELECQAIQLLVLVEADVRTHAAATASPLRVRSSRSDGRAMSPVALSTHSPRSG